MRVTLPNGRLDIWTSTYTRARDLLSNAVRFTAAGDVLVVVTAGAATEGSFRLSVSVTDSGIGITTDRQGQLFEPFRLS